jgi:hypothetical protein
MPIFDRAFSEYIQVPEFGTFTDKKSIETRIRNAHLDRIFAIGGESGWYGIGLGNSAGLSTSFSAAWVCSADAKTNQRLPW